MYTISQYLTNSVATIPAESTIAASSTRYRSYINNESGSMSATASSSTITTSKRRHTIGIKDSGGEIQGREAT